MILERAPNTSVKYANARGITAQLLAALYHHVDILRLLADRGANVNLANQRRCTPLRFAVAQMMSPNGLPRDPDPDGTRQVATVKALLQLGADTLPPRALRIRPRQGDRRHPGRRRGHRLRRVVGRLHAAHVRRGREPSDAGLAKLLLKRGADGAKRTIQAAGGHAAGSTALDIARKRRNAPTTLPTMRRRWRCSAGSAAARAA